MALWTPANLAVPPRSWFNGDNVVFSGSNFSSCIDAGSEGGSYTGAGTPVKATLNSLFGLSFTTLGQKLTKVLAAWGTSGRVYTFNVTNPNTVTSGATPGLFHKGVFADGAGVIQYGIPGDEFGEAFMLGNGFNGGDFSPGYSGYGASVPAATPTFLATGIGGASQELWIYGTDQYAGVTPGTTANCPNYASATWTLGESWDPTVYNGACFQWLVFDYFLSTSDRQKCEGWAAWKYNLQSLLPAGHPYKSAAPTTGTTTPITALATSTAPALLKRLLSRPILKTSTALASLKRSLATKILKTSTALASLKRSATRALLSATSSVASLKRSTAHAFLSATSSVALFFKAFAAGKAVAATSTPVASLVRSTARPVLSITSSVASLARLASFARAALAATSSLATVTKIPTRALLASSVAVASLRRLLNKAILSATSSVVSCLVTAGRFVSAVASSTSRALLRRVMSPRLLASSTSLARLSRTISTRLLAASVSAASLVVLRPFKILAASAAAAVVTMVSARSMAILAASASWASLSLTLSTGVSQLARRLTGVWQSAQLSGVRKAVSLIGRRSSTKLDGTPL